MSDPSALTNSGTVEVIWGEVHAQGHINMGQPEIDLNPFIKLLD